MNKAQMITAIAIDTKHPKSVVESIINSEQKTIKESVAKNEPVKYVDFGTYEARPQAARTVKNPRTKIAQDVDAKMTPKFNPAKSFKEDVADKLEIPEPLVELSI